MRCFSLTFLVLIITQCVQKKVYHPVPICSQDLSPVFVLSFAKQSEKLHTHTSTNFTSTNYHFFRLSLQFCAKFRPVASSEAHRTVHRAECPCQCQSSFRSAIHKFKIRLLRSPCTPVHAGWFVRCGACSMCLALGAGTGNDVRRRLHVSSPAEFVESRR